MLNFFDKEKCASLWKLKTLLKTKIKTDKKIHCVLEFNQSQWLKPYIEWRQRWKNVVPINEQCYIWKNNGNCKKWKWCKLMELKLVSNKKVI